MENIELIKEVRNRSHASLKDCASAVEESGGDIEKALKILQEKGIIKAAGHARLALEGRTHSYVHGDAKLTVVVEVNCETDFAAKNELFIAFCDAVALQIAGMNPLYISRDEIPEGKKVEQKEIFMAQLNELNKPPAIKEQIVKGKMDKWYAEVCLLEQESITGSFKSIETLRAVLSSQLGETIAIRRFVRWEVGK